MNTAIIVPSRGRPDNIARLYDALVTTGFHGDLIVGLDDDDAHHYPRLVGPGRFDVIYEVNPRLRLGPTLNLIATGYAGSYDVLGFMGDDHLPQGTWQSPLEATLADLGTGIVYGNDLLQGGNIPTAVFMTSDIVRCLGWMCPPGLVHMYLDNAWLELGRAIGRIRYRPDVVIEHLHYTNGKAAIDGSYAETNSTERYDADQEAYRAWRDGPAFAADVAKLTALL